MDPVLKLLAEAFHVQADLLGVGHDVALVEVGVAIELVVHLPELALGAGRLGRLGRQLGMEMRRGDGQVTVDVANPITQYLLQLLDVVVDQPAVWALVIAVFDQHDPGVGRTLGMVALAHWDDQAGLGCGFFTRHNYFRKSERLSRRARGAARSSLSTDLRTPAHSGCHGRRDSRHARRCGSSG